MWKCVYFHTPNEEKKYLEAHKIEVQLVSNVVSWELGRWEWELCQKQKNCDLN